MRNSANGNDKTILEWNSSGTQGFIKKTVKDQISVINSSRNRHFKNSQKACR